MFLLLISFITGRRLIYLEDYAGKVHKSIEWVSPFGKRTSYVYWFNKIGPVILNDDGTTGGVTIYIKKWKYAF